MKTQRTIFSNIPNKSNFNSNTNKTQKKHSLTRYNSHKRLTSNNKENILSNYQNKKATSKNQKFINNNYKKLPNDNSKRNNKTTKINQGKPLTTNKKKIIPLCTNQYKTISDNNYLNYINKIHNDININRNYFKTPDNNTIDLNDLCSNKKNNIPKNYNLNNNKAKKNYNNSQIKKVEYNRNYNKQN